MQLWVSYTKKSIASNGVAADRQLGAQNFWHSTVQSSTVLAKTAECGIFRPPASAPPTACEALRYYGARAGSYRPSRNQVSASIG